MFDGAYNNGDGGAVDGGEALRAELRVKVRGGAGRICVEDDRGHSWWCGG